MAAVGRVVAGVGVQVVVEGVRQLLNLRSANSATQFLHIVRGAKSGDLDALGTLQEP